MLRRIRKQSGESVESVLKKKKKEKMFRWEGFASSTASTPCFWSTICF